MKTIVSIFLCLLACSIKSEGGIHEKISAFFGDSDAQHVVEEMLAFADIEIGGSRAWDIKVHDDRFYSRVLKDGSLGLGESYMEGWWDSEALDQMMFRITRTDLERNLKPTLAMRWSVFKAKFLNKQDKSGSMKVIDAHYQLGNDLFAYMLDDMLTYSCGYWKTAANLNEAQRAKFDLIAKKLELKPGMRVLDIGCGWGCFAKYIAENYGVEVLGVTLSENQALLARERCKGLPVTIEILDYRDVKGKFDRVVEIGMFEHVGYKNYRTFMELVYRCLNDNGLFMLHTIGRDTTSTTIDPWIDRYIFPNGNLPSVSQVGEAIEGLFVMEDWHNFGAFYDNTLMAWFDNFNNNWDHLKASYPDPFYRMWKFYLLSCAGAFRARNIQLWQVVLSKKGVVGGYNSIR